MTKQKAIKDSISHWERMIAWAKNRRGAEYTTLLGMNISIEEDWGGRYCPLCLKYQKMDPQHPDSSSLYICTKCPLAQKYGRCGRSSRNGWFSVTMATSWKEWVRNAEKFLVQLKRLQKNKKILDKQKKRV